MTESKIIVVDDNANVLKSFQRILRPEFEQVLTASRPALLPIMLRTGYADVVLMDVNFGKENEFGKDAVYWLKKMLKISLYPSIIIITAPEHIELAVSSFENAAVDFIVKPWDNDRLIITVGQAITSKRIRDVNPGAEITKPKNFIEHLQNKYAWIYSKQIPTLDMNARRKLNELMDLGYIELLDIYIEQMILLSESADKYMNILDFTMPSYFTLEEIEMKVIDFVLKKYNRSISTCAKILKISHQTLNNKMKKYNL